MTVATLRVCDPDGQNSKFRHRFPLFLAQPKKNKILPRWDLNRPQKTQREFHFGRLVWLPLAKTTTVTPPGANMYVSVNSFLVSLRISNFRVHNFHCEFSKSVTTSFSLPKIIITCKILYTSFAIPEPTVTHLRKKIKIHALSTVVCFYIFFFCFTHFVRFMLIIILCILFRKREWGLCPSLRSGAVTLKFAYYVKNLESFSNLHAKDHPRIRHPTKMVTLLASCKMD